MTTREIQGHLLDLCRVEVSPTLISHVTDAVLEEVKAWQSRPLEAVYPIVYLDAIHLKRKRSIYGVLLIRARGCGAGDRGTTAGDFWRSAPSTAVA